MADNIWTNASSGTSTTWGNSDGGNSTTWERTSSPATLIIDYSTSQTAIGSYSSVSAASTAIQGTKYHLRDNSPFFYGTDKDFKSYYDSSAESMIFTSSEVKASDGFFSIRNSPTNEIFGITYEGILKLEEQTILSSTDQAGRVAFSSNELYISKG